MKEKEKILDKESTTFKLENLGDKTMNKNVLSKNELIRIIRMKEKGITLIALVVTIVLNCSYLAME